MFNVLLRLTLIALTAMAIPASAQPAAFCPEGWSCGKPEGHSAEMRKTRDGGDVCLMSHILRTDDGAWQMAMTIYSVDSGPDTHLGFGLSLMKRMPPDTEYKNVPLRSFRILGANRRLDTREWKLSGVESGSLTVQIPFTENDRTAAVAAIGVATGAAYGVLGETKDGRRVRIEARTTPRVPAVIRDFQACLENRDMPVPK